MPVGSSHLRVANSGVQLLFLVRLILSLYGVVNRNGECELLQCAHLGSILLRCCSPEKDRQGH